MTMDFDVISHSPVAYGKSVVYQGLFSWSAIGHIENGFANPLSYCLRLERVLRGVKRSQGISTRQRLPVTLAVLSSIRAGLNFDCYDDILFWAACCTGFFGFLRSGEFTTPSSKFDSRIHLALSDVKIDKHINPKVIFLHIKCSKTDPFRQGSTICLGITGKDICAVRALLHYLHLRGGDAGPLLRHSTGSPLTRATLTTWLTNAVARAGLSGNFSGHSFRIGAATSAAAAGIPGHLIKTLARWFSNAYQLYIQTRHHIIETVPARIVCNNNHNNNNT